MLNSNWKEDTEGKNVTMESINNTDTYLLTLVLSKQWKLSKLGEALITVLATYTCQSTTVQAGAQIFTEPA